MVYRPQKQQFERIDFVAPGKKEQPKLIVPQRQLVKEKKQIKKEVEAEELPTIEVEFEPFMPFPSTQ